MKKQIEEKWNNEVKAKEDDLYLNVDVAKLRTGVTAGRSSGSRGGSAGRSSSGRCGPSGGVSRSSPSRCQMD